MNQSPLFLDSGYAICDRIFEPNEMSHLLVLPDDEVERLARERSAADCTTTIGGVVAMRPLTVHASSKSIDDRPRRVLHIEYADSVKLGPHIELARV